MKTVSRIFLIIFFIFFTKAAAQQAIGLIGKDYKISLPEKNSKLLLNSLSSGTYSIGKNGYFLTIDSAFNKLSVDGITGPVTLELIDTLYTAPAAETGFLLNGPIPGASAQSKVIFKPAANKNVIIEGNGKYVLCFVNTSYFMLDGISLNGSATLKIHSYYNNQFSFNTCLDFIYDSDNNVIQNITFISDDITRLGGGPGLGSDNEFVPDSNLIQNNFIKKSGISIYISTFYSDARADGNIIRGNIVGSETDSLNGWGIQVEKANNTIIENNIVKNVKRLGTRFNIIHGINSHWCNGTIIRNNVIHNIYDSNSKYCAAGILLSGGIGNNNIVYNNAIYDIKSSSKQSTSCVAGIHLCYQFNTKIYYNSVYLFGTGNEANPAGSAALYINMLCSDVEAKNNILINTRDESPNCASSIKGNSGSSTFISNYNDLYCTSNQYNCLVNYCSRYVTLENWQHEGQDLNSITGIPHFKDQLLHIDDTIPTNIESQATYINGIDKDRDGDQRNITTPDIGADEFNGTAVGVKYVESLPVKFTLEQNYPNPFNLETMISWRSPISCWQTLKVYDALGKEVATLVNGYKPAGRYEVEFDAAILPSGVYFYQLKATPNGGQAGEYTAVKKMLLIK